MLEMLKQKIEELEVKKDKLSDKEFTGYEFKTHMECYLELKGIDYTLYILKGMLIDLLQAK